LNVPIYTFVANLKNMSLLTVHSNANLILCFQAQYSPNTVIINNNSVYWTDPGVNSQNGTCTFTVLANGLVQNVTSQFRYFSMVPYAMAVFFQNATAQSYADVLITIGSVNDTCQENEVSVLPDLKCVNTTSIMFGENIEVPKNNSVVYKFQLPTTSLTGSFTVKCSGNNTMPNLDFRVQRDGSPIHGKQGNCTHPLLITYPAFGLNGYYLMVSNNNENTTRNFTVTAEECYNNTGGPGCTEIVMNATAVPKITMMLQTIYYFKINASIGSPVWASVRRVNGTAEFVVNPWIFASLNQLPTPASADIGGCNQYFCDYVNTIHFNVTQNQTWYIGIQNSDPYYNATIAGIWFNSICAPDCNDHGTCVESGLQTGWCNCIDGYIGVDCNTQNGFGPQFIVLIIIAVLVALTAIIGFGAWAYMRRKRGQYDIVS